MANLPKRLCTEFFEWMETHDDGSLSDGAWFCMLEDAGREFCESHEIGYMDGNDAAHYYLKLKQKQRE